MRTDVKIGVIVAGILAVIFVVWVVVNQVSGPEEQPAAQLEVAEVEPGRTNLIESTEPLPPAEPAPPAEPGEPVEPPEPLPPAEPAAPPDTITPGYADTAPPAPPADTSLSARTPAHPADTSSGRDTSGRWWASSETPARVPALTAVAGERTYVVQKGDTYWSIAEREYGNPSLFKIIQEANPTVPPRALRPNKTIRIPPPPEKALAAPGPAGGTVDVDAASGKRFYIVKKDDTKGFWGIAQGLYGHGKHFKLLQEANPNVNPNKLRPGQKIWAPERMPEAEPGALDTAPPAAAAPGAPSAPTLSVETGAPRRTVLPDGRVFD